MAKTIKEIAAEIGVSKQAVYKRYKGKLYAACAPYAHTKCGVLYLSEQAENIIKKDFLKDMHSNGAHTEHSNGAHTEHSNGAHTEHSNGAHTEPQENKKVLEILRTTIDTLQEQLRIKDRQIEQLSAALVAAQQTAQIAQRTAQAEQALHAGTMQQQLADSGDRTIGSKSEKKIGTKDRHWFSRWFRKD